MSVGAIVSQSDAQNTFIALCNQLVGVMYRIQAFNARAGQGGDVNLNALYGATDGPTAVNLLDTLVLLTTYASYAPNPTTVTSLDNRSGSTPANLTVPTGSYAVVTSDPVAISLLQGIDVDHAKIVRQASNLTTF